MKVKIIKTFCNENGISFLKGRTIEVSEDQAKEFETMGVIDTIEPKKETKKKKG